MIDNVYTTRREVLGALALGGTAALALGACARPFGNEPIEWYDAKPKKLDDSVITGALVEKVGFERVKGDENLARLVAAYQGMTPDQRNDNSARIVEAMKGLYNNFGINVFPQSPLDIVNGMTPKQALEALTASPQEKRGGSIVVIKQQSGKQDIILVPYANGFPINAYAISARDNVMQSLRPYVVHEGASLLLKGGLLVQMYTLAPSDKKPQPTFLDVHRVCTPGTDQVVISTKVPSPKEIKDLERTLKETKDPRIAVKQGGCVDTYVIDGFIGGAVGVFINPVLGGIIGVASVIETSNYLNQITGRATAFRHNEKEPISSHYVTSTIDETQLNRVNIMYVTKHQDGAALTVLRNIPRDATKAWSVQPDGLHIPISQAEFWFGKALLLGLGLGGFYTGFGRARSGGSEPATGSPLIRRGGPDR